MGGGDFEAEIRNSLSALTSKVDAFSRSSQKANHEVKDLGKEAAEKFAAAGRHARHAAEETEGLGTELRHAGHALKGLGGILGEASHKLTAGLRMGGGMAGLAAAAAVAGVAWEVSNKILERTQDEIKETIELTDKLRKSLREAKWKGEDQTLSTAMQYEQSIRLLHARGGVEGEDKATAIAKEGIGISTKDAMAGVSESYLINDPKIRERAIELGKVLAQTGEMSFAEAIKAIAGDQVLQTQIGAGGFESVGAQMIASANGQLPTTDNLDRASDEIRGVGRLDPNGRMRPLNKIIGQANEGVEHGIEGLALGTAGAAADRQLDQTLDPVGFEQDQFKRERGEITDALRHLGNSQNGLLRAIDRFFKKFGGKGTPGDQAAHQERITNTATNGATIGTD